MRPARRRCTGGSRPRGSCPHPPSPRRGADRCGSSAGTGPTAPRGPWRTPRRSTRAPTGRRTRCACRARPRARSGGRSACPAAADATTHGGCPSSRRGRLQRIALQQRSSRIVEPRDLVLADQRVAAVHVRRGDRAAPHGGRPVVRIAPQRVVVAERLGHVAERVGARLAVPRRLGMQHRHAQPRPQRRHTGIGQSPLVDRATILNDEPGGLNRASAPGPTKLSAWESG